MKLFLCSLSKSEILFFFGPPCFSAKIELHFTLNYAAHVNQDVNQKHRMNASVSIVCYKSKTLSNGESPLMLQVSKSGKRKYQSLGISIKPHYWDFTRNKPKPNCPNKEYI